MTKKAQHTTTPWFVNVWTTGRRTVEANTIVICEVHNTHEGNAANAEHIVRAVNCHEDLLAACINAEHALIERARDLPGVWNGSLAQLQTAISKAEGRTA